MIKATKKKHGNFIPIYPGNGVAKLFVDQSFSIIIQGLRVGTDIRDLLFADDMIVFCQSDAQKLLHLQCILLWFEAMSRLHVNLSKSEMIPVGRGERD